MHRRHEGAIVTLKPQTTRTRVVGVRTTHAGWRTSSTPASMGALDAQPPHGRDRAAHPRGRRRPRALALRRDHGGRLRADAGAPGQQATHRGRPEQDGSPAASQLLPIIRDGDLLPAASWCRHARRERTSPRCRTSPASCPRDRRLPGGLVVIEPARPCAELIREQVVLAMRDETVRRRRSSSAGRSGPSRASSSAPPSQGRSSHWAPSSGPRASSCRDRHRHRKALEQMPDAALLELFVRVEPGWLTIGAAAELASAMAARV